MEKGKENRELLKLDRAIRDFYFGKISTSLFIELYWKNSWNSLIQYVEQSGFNMRNGKIPQALLDKKEEFENALCKYYYSEVIKIEIGDLCFIDISKEDINRCIVYLRITEQFSSKSIEQTLKEYLMGKIPEIKETPISKGIPRKEAKKLPDWYIPWKQAEYLEPQIARFYRKKTNLKKFIQIYAGSWEDLINYMVEASKKGHITKNKSREEILKKMPCDKEQFEATIMEYMLDEYVKTTSFVINGQRFNPTIESVNASIEYLRQNGMDLGISSIEQTVKNFLTGKITVQQNTEKNLKEEPDEIGEENAGIINEPQNDDMHEDLSRDDELTPVDLPKDAPELVDVFQSESESVESTQEDKIDLKPLKEQRTKCEILEKRYEQMQADYGNMTKRLEELRIMIAQSGMDMTKIQEFAKEILDISERIERHQEIINEMDKEMNKEKQELKNMKVAAIAEIEKI